MKNINRRISAIFGLETGIVAFFAVILFGLCVLPFLKIFKRIYVTENGLDFSILFEALKVESVQRAIVNTLVISIAVAVVCLLTAVPLGWLVVRTNLPFKKGLRSVLSLPFAIPPFIGAIAWIFLANPTTGLLNHVLGGNIFNIYSKIGLIFVESSFLYTFIFLSVVSALEQMDSTFEEAARISGASPFRVFYEISLPILRPALVSGAMLVVLATAASFGVPALIGGPGKIFLLTTQIYTLQKMGSVGALFKAGALSTLLMVWAAILMAASASIERRNQYQIVSGKTARANVVDLGPWRIPIFGVILFFIFVVFALPMLGILLSSLSHVQGELGISNFSFENWNRVLLHVDETPRAFTNSLILAAGSASIAVIIALFISYTVVKTRLPGRKLLDMFAALPYATPGTVVAFALIVAFSGSFLGIVPSLYNTLTLIMIAYLVKYLSFAVKTLNNGFSQIDNVLSEASRVSGASWGTTMLRIWLPLLLPAIVAAWFLVFMPAMSELTMTTLLTGPGLETIGTLIFQLQEYADASGGSSSVLAVFVVAGVLLINLLVKLTSKGKYGL